MSNPIRRPELRGAIVQQGQIIGGLDIPEPPEPFLEQFARTYARLGLTVAPVEELPTSLTRPWVPPRRSGTEPGELRRAG